LYNLWVVNEEKVTSRCVDRKQGVKWEWDRKCVSRLRSLLRLDHEEVIVWRCHSRTTARTPHSRKGGGDRDQLTESSSVVSSGLGEGKGTAAGERDTNEAEGETEGGRADNSNGDIIRVNMGDGEGDEVK